MQNLLPLAMEYHRAGHLDQADLLYGQLTGNMAELAQVVHLRGLIAQSKGQRELTLRYAAQAAALEPENADYQLLLGSCYHELGKHDAALECYQRALSLNADPAVVFHNTAIVYQALNRLELALSASREVVARRPEWAQGQLCLGSSAARLGYYDEAERAFRAVIRLEPDNIFAWRNLGHVFKERGQFVPAQDAYRQVLQRRPLDGHAVFGLSQLRRFSRLDLNWCHELERGMTAPGVTVDDRISLHFALGKIYEDIGHYAVAFSQYSQGNTLVAAPFDRSATVSLVDELIGTFTPEWFAARAGFGSPSEQPVFVVGLFRSGTTLVEQILSSHSQIHGCGELVDIEHVRFDLPLLTGEAFPRGVSQLTPTQTLALANDYLLRRQRESSSALRSVDKLPFNFLNLGLISLLFPRARIIHCVRDPRDTCFSCFASRFTMRPEYCSRLSDLGFYYRQYERLMSHWRRTLPLPILDVSYEDLVSDQRGISRRLVEFCGLPWEDACFRFHENPRPVQTSSDWQVRQPMYSSSVGRWQRFAPYLNELFEALDESTPTH